jgi:CRISPR-associated protein Cmr2
VGIAVAHHLEPMSDALTLARAAEKEAKKTRNALAITVSKRSGSDRTVAGLWGVFERQLNTFICLHRDNAIPDGAAYELFSLADTYGDLPIEALQQEAIRILKRKRTSKGEKVSDAVLQQMTDAVLKTCKAREIVQLAHTLIIARMFADAMTLAQTPIREEQCK